MVKVNQKNEPPLSQNSLTHVGAVQAPRAEASYGLPPPSRCRPLSLTRAKSLKIGRSRESVAGAPWPET
jgi:hypothetical protein